jgi:hypothetical protein
MWQTAMSNICSGEGLPSAHLDDPTPDEMHQGHSAVDQQCEYYEPHQQRHKQYVSGLQGCKQAEQAEESGLCKT